MPRGVRTPPNLRVLGGREVGRDSGGRPIAPAAPAEREAPPKPADLSAAASVEWDRIVAGSLTELKVLKPEDLAVLHAYVELYALVQSSLKALAVQGITQTVTRRDNGGGKTTKREESPEVRTFLRLSAELRSYVNHLGLSPQAEAAAWQTAIAGNTGDPNTMWDPVTRTGNPFAG